MAFFRTPSGIANQALFLGKQVVVYVEEDSELDPGRSIDKAFWRTFFARSSPGASFEFKGLGGKRYVVDMAQEIIGKSIPNVLCALDADYDKLFGDIILDERVFYTFGYGVENDLFGQACVRNLFHMLVPGDPDPDVRGEAVWRNISSTIRLETFALLSDQIAASRGHSTLDRKKSTSVLQSTKVTPIRFKKSAILARIREAKSLEIVRVAAERLAATASSVPAHLYFDIVYHTLLCAIRPTTKVIYDKDHIRNGGLALFRGAFIELLPGNAVGHYEMLAARDIAKYHRA